jgi:hypothetical protein
MCGFKQPATDVATDADWGSATLVANTAPEPPDRFECIALCMDSKSMLLNCLTYQMTLDPKHAKHVDEYYARSIVQFRKTLSEPNWWNDELSTWAGILLCSISVSVKAT